MPAARKRRNFSFGATQYSARLGGTYTTDKERKRRIAEQRREGILDKKLRAQELAAEAKLKAAEKKIAAVEKVADQKIETAKRKIWAAEQAHEIAERRSSGGGRAVSKGALTEAGFEAIKARMEREIEAQERHKQAAIAKYGNPRANPSFGYGVYTPGIFGEEQIAHFKSKPAAETWARSNDIKGYKIKRAFAKNPAVSAAQYRLAQAVLSGYNTESTMPRSVAQEIVDRTPARLRSIYTMGSAGGSANPRQPFTLSIYDSGRFESLGTQQFGKRSEMLSAIHELRKSYRIESQKAIGKTQLNITVHEKNPGGSGPQPRAHFANLRNPEPAQDDGSEEYKQASRTAELFHGRPVKEEIEVKEVIKTHDWYVSIGPLVSLKVKTILKQRATFKFSLKEGQVVYVFCSPDGRQMYLRGGDQEINLEPLGLDGEDWKRDRMVIGEIKEITYRDAKRFQKFVPTDFYHKLGEESKVKPWLVYDTMNKHLEIVGGKYFVDTKELVDGMSPGLRD
jgi:hypothetical protein